MFISLENDNSCPQCGSTQQSVKAKTSTGFQFASNRRCLNCGCIWTPRCPTWAAIASLLAGVFVMLFCAAMALARFRYEHASVPIEMLFPFALIGGTAAVYGISVLRRRAGLPTIQARGGRTIDEVRKLPVGIRVTHSPDPALAATGVQDAYTFTWVFSTTVEAIERPLRVIEFGCFSELGDEWHFSTATGRPFNGGEFAEWYSCPDAELRPGEPAKDPKNWSAAQQLSADRMLWYYIALDEAGNAFRGEAVIEMAARLGPP